jgi:hypothetical protein
MALKRNAGILSILSLLIAGSPIILAAYSPFIADNMFPIFSRLSPYLCSWLFTQKKDHPNVLQQL